MATNDLVLIADTSDSNAIKSMDIDSIISLAPQGDITAVVAGTNISGGGSSGSVTLNVDDAFLKNDANDTTSGTITAAGFTTSGSITLGGHAFNDIDLAGEFVDADDHIMSSAAINDRITSFGYTTNTGDITGVTAGTGLSGGGSSGGVTVNLDIDGLGLAPGGATDDTVAIYDESASAIKKLPLSDIVSLAPQGDITNVSAGVGLSGGGSSGSVTLTLDMSELTDMTASVNSSQDELIILDNGADRRKLISEIPLSAFDNDSGFTTTSGDITGVTAGVGLSGGGSSGGVTLTLDMSELTDMTADVNSSQDELIILDNGADRRKLISEIPLSAFDNDSGFTTTSGDITGVTAGDGLTGGGSSGSVTLNVVGGDGITANANDIAITAAQTTITSVKNTSLVVGRDADNGIHFSTDNAIKVEVNGVQDEFRFVAGGEFHADADIVAFSSTTASDRNLKENIEELPYGLDDVMKMRAVEFDWKKDKANGKERGHDIGVIAQEMEEVIPEVVKEYEGLQGKDNFKAVSYSKIVPVLIKAVQELKAEIEELKK